MRTAAAVIVAAVALVTAPIAHAGMTWDFATAVARDYWQGRASSCDPRPRLLTPEESADNDNSHESGYVYMLAAADTCEVLISPTAEWHRKHRGYGWEYCEAVVHEFGHFAGLGDDAEGMGYETPFGCVYPRQWMVERGWRKPPRWVRSSPARVERLWLEGRSWRARVVRARWLKARARRPGRPDTAA